MAEDFLPLPPNGLAPDDVWWMEPESGIRLRAALWSAPDALGHVVFLTGRTEYLEKVAIPAAQFVQRGYSVISLDWRGQGLSSRQVSPALKGHIDDFTEFQTDLDALLATDQAKALTGPRLLVAHSMGGCIAAHAMNRPQIRDTLDGSILSAPMLGIEMNPVMRVLAWITVMIASFLGKLQCWPPFGDVKTPYVLSNPKDNVLTSDTDVMDWMTQIATDHPTSSIAAPTLGWFSAATKAMKTAAGFAPPSVPVLCLLGCKERVVDPKAVKTGAKRMGAHLVTIEEAQHELFIEQQTLRDKAWEAVDAFLDANTLPRNNGQNT